MTKPVKKPVIRFVKPRQTVEVHLPDGRVLSGPRGTPLEHFLMKLPEARNPLIVGGIVNTQLRELTYPIELDVRVQPITMKDSDGARIYRRSLTFLLETAFEALFPDVVLSVDHSVASGGYYCKVRGRPPLTRNELKLLEKTMRNLVAQDLPFQKEIVPLEEAMQYFEQRGYPDKVLLLKYRQKPTLVLYQLGEHRDYHHGYMVPSTGYLRWFDLKLADDGFVLRFPRRQFADQLLPLPESKTLFRTFRQYGDWLEKLGIDNVGALNEAIHQNRIRQIILVSEALHEQKIAEIARSIVAQANRARVVLIAGPSSSGKTTFSKRLTMQLLALGLSPFALEMDNYFVERDKTPLDEDGKPDFEALEALDTALLTEHIRRLIAGEEVQLPYYNFKTGKRETGDTVKLEKGQIIIAEGIHGLNPQLLPDIPREMTFRIYISALTQLNLDRHNRISTTDTRLLRRIVRDMRERGYTAQQTIARWESVRRGERRHIFPYQDNADEMFNSALVYELSALRPLAEPLLRQVPFGSPEYIEAKRLLAFLEWFLPLENVDFIPNNSILREFIGGSILGDFKVWK